MIIHQDITQHDNNNNPLNNNKPPEEDNNKQSQDNNINLFDDLFDEKENKKTNINQESVVKYIQNLDDDNREALEKLIQNDEDIKNTNISDFKLTEENIKHLNINKVVEYLTKLKAHTSYEKLKQANMELDLSFILKLTSACQDDDLLAETISKIPSIRIEAFNINDQNQIRFLRKINVSSRVARHNPTSSASFIEKAEKSLINNSYFICYDNDKIVGLFSIYNTSAQIGDAWSFFMVVDNSVAGKGYGTAVSLAAITQIANLANKGFITCNSIQTLVENDNIGSMKIMKKLKGKILFSGLFSRSLDATKFDLTNIYNICSQAIDQSTTIGGSQEESTF